MPAVVRTGGLVIGLAGLEAGPPQRFGGLEPHAGAGFDRPHVGIEGAGARGASLGDGGGVERSNGNGSAAQVAFRPPIGMSSAPRAEDPSVRRVTLPFLAAGG